MADDPLAAYPVRIAVPVAWGEMDAMGHVNNVVYLRYFESVRMVYLERIGLMAHMQEHGVGPILAETRCRFRLPLEAATWSGYSAMYVIADLVPYDPPDTMIRS